MTCSKLRFASRLRVEDLESRLQPGSMITGSGYGWSLLADNLLILNQGSLDSQSLVGQSSSESSKPTQTSAPIDTHSDNLQIAVIAAAAARSQNSSLPSTTLSDNLATGLTTEDLSKVSLTGHSNSVPLAAVAQPTVQQQSAAATPVGSVSQSPTGVAAPAAPIQNGSTAPAAPQAEMVAAPTADKLDSQVVSVGPLQTGPAFQVTTQSFQNPGVHAASTVAWASYLGFTGDDRLLSVTLDPNNVAAQPVVVVGFSQNPSDSTDFRGIVARFSKDGTAATVLTLDVGANTRTELHSAAVDPNDGSIYVTGQITQNGATTDLIARINSTTSGVDWSLSHSPNTSATGNSVKLDSTGQILYVTGAIDGAASVTQLKSLNTSTPTTGYDVGINFPAGPSVGNGVAPDSQGNADLAIQIQATPDAIPAIAQLNATGTLVNWATGFNSKGPNGTSNAVVVDQMDQVFITGGFGSSNPPLADELIASLDSAGNLLNGVGIRITGGGQIVGYGIQLDATGNVFTGVTDSDTGLIGNMAFLEVDAGFTAIVESKGDAFGPLDDQNRGLALDQSSSTLYLAGFTNSPTFTDPQGNSVTTGSFQATYGGGPQDGVLIKYQVS